MSSLDLLQAKNKSQQKIVFSLDPPPKKIKNFVFRIFFWRLFLEIIRRYLQIFRKILIFKFVIF